MDATIAGDIILWVCVGVILEHTCDPTFCSERRTPSFDVTKRTVNTDESISFGTFLLPTTSVVQVVNSVGCVSVCPSVRMEQSDL